ncbi:MAG: hypothetical protein M3447_05640 [Acidobacteriota bacterium]|nr:hypothetical protein [Acidobacteriota bacterium]
MANSVGSRAQPSNSWRAVVATAFRVLTFRASREELHSLSIHHLAFGLVCTWIVGMGRYYDNPRVGLLQHLGVGSVIYVFVFSLFIWLIVAPLRPGNWRYLRICAFVALVSPPAVLYAIPVERLFDLDTANSLNVWFLAVVATWRVALLLFFFKRSTELSWFSAMVAALLPLSLIVVVLQVLNLEKAVFSLMGGLSEKTPNDAAFAALVTLSIISFLLFIPLVLCYLGIVIVKVVNSRQRRADESGV